MNTAPALLALCHEVSDRALSWLDGAAPQFAEALDTLADEGPDQLDVDDTLKPVAELAMMAYLVEREGVTGQAGGRIAPRLLQLAWEQVWHGQLLHARQLRFPQATESLECYVWFARAGLHNPELESLLASLARLRASGACPEFQPTRELAVLRAVEHLGLPGHTSIEHVVEHTWLGRTPPPWMADGISLYAVTHAVYHLTDWGARPAALPPHLATYLRAWLPAWLEVYCEAEHWDLVAELLLTDACLPEPDRPAAIWKRLAAAQHSDGLLPYGPVPVPEDAAAAWRDHYHPTIAAALAGTMTLSRGLDQSEADPAGSADPAEGPRG